MSDKEQIEHFSSDLDNLIERYRKEYDLSYASVIGTLQVAIHVLCNETADNADEEEGE